MGRVSERPFFQVTFSRDHWHAAGEADAITGHASGHFLDGSGGAIGRLGEGNQLIVSHRTGLQGKCPKYSFL